MHILVRDAIEEIFEVAIFDPEILCNNTGFECVITNSNLSETIIGNARFEDTIFDSDIFASCVVVRTKPRKLIGGAHKIQLEGFRRSLIILEEATKNQHVFTAVQLQVVPV
jgi:hypothetical protein